MHPDTPNPNLIASTAAACETCLASCCHLEVFIISDTGVPEQYIHTDASGSQTMRRLEDGWCSALDRNTLSCGIYEQRPWLCREFAMGSRECQAEYQQR